jgi:hypothetical protein
MKRITVDVSDETYEYIKSQKDQKGSSISFEANALIVNAIIERQRKKKLPLQDGSKNIPV